jgi:hypothetical protein
MAVRTRWRDEIEKESERPQSTGTGRSPRSTEAGAGQGRHVALTSVLMPT